MKLTENFSLAEMTKSETALRLDMDNTPEPEHLENMKALAENVLQPIRNCRGYYPTYVNGWGGKGMFLPPQNLKYIILTLFSL